MCVLKVNGYLLQHDNNIHNSHLCTLTLFLVHY